MALDSTPKKKKSLNTGLSAISLSPDAAETPPIVDRGMNTSEFRDLEALRKTPEYQEEQLKKAMLKNFPGLRGQSVLGGLGSFGTSEQSVLNIKG